MFTVTFLLLLSLLSLFIGFFYIVLYRIVFLLFLLVNHCVVVFSFDLFFNFFSYLSVTCFAAAGQQISPLGIMKVSILKVSIYNIFPLF